MNLFKSLRSILEVKRRTLKQSGEQLAGYEDTNAQGFDRFVVRDWEKGKIKFSQNAVFLTMYYCGILTLINISCLIQIYLHEIQKYQL